MQIVYFSGGRVSLSSTHQVDVVVLIALSYKIIRFFLQNPGGGDTL